MALGGVETGSTTATEADRPAATAGTTGSTPAACAMETTIGMAIVRGRGVRHRVGQHHREQRAGKRQRHPRCRSAAGR